MRIGSVPAAPAINPCFIIAIKPVLEPHLLRRDKTQASKMELKLFRSWAQCRRGSRIGRLSISNHLFDNHRGRQVVCLQSGRIDSYDSASGWKPQRSVGGLPACRLEPSVAFPALHSIRRSLRDIGNGFNFPRIEVLQFFFPTPKYPFIAAHQKIRGFVLKDLKDDSVKEPSLFCVVFKPPAPQPPQTAAGPDPQC